MSYYLPPKLSPAAEALLQSPPSTSNSQPLQSLDGLRQTRAASWSGWVRNVFPSNRPEKGRTIRASGYWEKQEQKIPGPRRRRIASSRRSDHSEVVSPDRLTRWNTAKKLPQDQKDKKFSVTPSKSASAKYKMSETVVAPSGDRGRTFTDDKGPSREAETTEHLTCSDKNDNNQDGANMTSRTSSIVDRRLSNVRRTLEAKNETRRQRRSLKESGDYLGVQGINPETGQLDVITPTESERSSTSNDTLQRINTVRQTLRDAKESYKGATAWTEREMKRVLVGKEKSKHDRLEKEKRKHQDIIQSVKWRRNTKQWSSVHEPNLSPITQSQTSTDHSSLKRPSAQTKLVDFDSSRRCLPDASEPVSEAESQDSANTTIRTPHRLSLANPSGYARELFENGISFDNPNNKPRLHSQPGAPSIPSLCITTPRNSTRKLSLPNTPDHAESFLEIPDPYTACSTFRRSLWDPEQTIPEQKIDESLISDQGTDHRHQVKEAASDSPCLELRGIKTELKFSQGDNHSAAHQADSGIHSATKDLIPVQTSPSRRRRLARRALYSMTNLRNHHEPMTQEDQKMKCDAAPREESGQRISILQAQPLTKDRIQQDLMHLRSELDKLNQQKTAAEPLENDQCLTDHEWIEDTIRDITQKSNQIVAECASTLTTIITGSDQPMSQSSQKNTETHQGQVVPKRRPLNRVLYNLPVEDSPNKLREWQTNLSSNMSAKGNVTPMPGTTDPTSTSHLAVTKQRTERLARHVQPRDRTKSIAELIMDSSQKSTSSTEAVVLHGASLANTLRHERPTQSMADARVEKAQRAEDVTTITKRKIRHGDNPVTSISQWPGVMMEQDLLRLPGSYPIHPDDAADTEHHSQIKSGDANIGMAVKGSINILFIFFILLTRLYWEIVGPVFRRRSDYWQRSAKGESTMVDVLVLLLASPLAVCGLTGLL